MMRRLISILAAGVLVAGTLFSTAGAASAGAAAAKRLCNDGSAHLNFMRGNTYFLGTPVSTFNGATVRLKPNANSTTLWTFCFEPAFPGGDQAVVYNRSLPLTSRDFAPGGFVTVTTLGNSGLGFASQRWHVTFISGTTTLQLKNAKTGLSLRVRNSCCFFGQTVTTGAVPTNWDFSI
jgi:hypothetical protein